MNIIGDTSRVSRAGRRVARTGMATLATLCGSVALMCAGWAADQSPALTKVVNYGDLNLATDTGAKALYGRLNGAAREVCNPLAEDKLALRRWHGCIDEAIGRAVEEIDSPALTAYHVDQTGKASQARLAMAKRAGAR
jgi:UrcA family protein